MNSQQKLAMAAAGMGGNPLTQAYDAVCDPIQVYCGKRKSDELDGIKELSVNPPAAIRHAGDDVKYYLRVCFVSAVELAPDVTGNCDPQLHASIPGAEYSTEVAKGVNPSWDEVRHTGGAKGQNCFWNL